MCSGFLTQKQLGEGSKLDIIARLRRLIRLGYSDEFKRECLKMYVNGSGFRAIERVKGVHHTTVITWVKQVGMQLPDAYDPEQIPEVGELDELETFVGSKKQNLDLDSGESL
jgi:transposase-like protein